MVSQDATAALVAPTSTLATGVQTPATPAVPANPLNDSNLWSIVDPDIVHENPVEDKHRRLVRSHRSSPYDRDLKPNAKNRDELAVRLHAFFPLYRRHDSFLGDPELSSRSTAYIRRKGSYLEISFLFGERQEGSHEIPEIGFLA
jgi:hypothetical protein